MASIKTPGTLKAATALLERFAQVQDRITVIESERNKAIAAANAEADARANDLITERNAIAGAIEPWFLSKGKKLLDSKRKSIELGGCMIGTRSGRDTLGINGDEKAIVKVLEKRVWAKELLVTTTRIDKAAVFKSIDGAYRKQLAAMGFSKVDGAETFFVLRAEQSGTRAQVSE